VKTPLSQRTTFVHCSAVLEIPAKEGVLSEAGHHGDWKERVWLPNLEDLKKAGALTPLGQKHTYWI
jgi:hypothetical protein